MIFVALATDYDGTLAKDGRVDGPTIEALRRLRSAGKRLIMVTGRHLADLQRAFGPLDLFDAAVVENGAVVFMPRTAQTRLVGEPPPPPLVEALRQKKVEPLSVGEGMVSTWEPHQTTVLETIRQLGLEWQVIFNKGAVMVLPPGVNKATGLQAALAELKLSPLNVVGVGDAENDHAFLSVCGCAVAVANALSAVKAAADIVTRADHGAGVAELIDRWLENPSRAFGGIVRHDVPLGEAEGEPARLSARGGAALMAGSSGVGKSRLATLLLERILEGGAQALVLDPEGDYDGLTGIAHLGDADRAPADEIVGLLTEPGPGVVANLLAVPEDDRPAAFAALAGPLTTLRREAGRPHWIVLDEAHHLLTPGLTKSEGGPPGHDQSVLLITARPSLLSKAAVAAVERVLAVGDEANDVIAEVCVMIGIDPPPRAPRPGDDAVLLWERGTEGAPRVVKVDQPKQPHQRHTRKYAEGRLGADKSFYFRGPDGALNLRAQNLATFLQLAQGVDDRTWLHHLQAGDYARWFRDSIGDPDLASEAEKLQAEKDPAASRGAMVDLVRRRYAVNPAI